MCSYCFNFFLFERRYYEKFRFLTACYLSVLFKKYCNVPKFSDRKVWATSADPDQTAPRLLLEEQSDQGLYWFPCRLHLLDSLLYGRDSMFKF